MRLISKAFLTLAIAVALLPAAAQAQPKPWVFGWWPEHWRDQDFKPGIDDAQRTHNGQWRGSKWRPEHWAQQRNNNAVEVVDGFYRADIIRDQYIDDEIPVLEVGPGFYMLGGEDKRRVADMIDFTFGMTSDHLYGMYTLKDWRTRKTIGVYTQDGLTLR